MKLEEILDNYNDNNLSREQAIFTSLFVIQNRLQTACEKIQNELSMKQWLLLTIVSVCPTSHTLTNIGRMMGCSRQNVKKLVSILEAKGYIEVVKGNNNSVCIELTDKVNEYSNEIGFKQVKILELLFKDFSEEEIKLVNKVEEYVGEDNE